MSESEEDAPTGTFIPTFLLLRVRMCSPGRASSAESGSGLSAWLMLMRTAWTHFSRATLTRLPWHHDVTHFRQRSASGLEIWAAAMGASLEWVGMECLQR
jgi:hypothetical protein